MKFCQPTYKGSGYGEKSKLKNIKDDNELPIYFHDNLTDTQAKLSYRARQLKQNNKIVDTWVINSKVMIKTGKTEFIMWNVRMTWTCLETENILKA